MDFKIDVSNTTIETKRLLLRPFEKSDLNDLFTYASVPGVGEMAGWGHHDSIETSQNILDMFIEEKEVFALYHKVDSKVIGSLGLHQSWTENDDKYKDLKVKEIGYVLSKDYWGQGLMPEAVNAVLAYCFNDLDLEAVTCSHFVYNNQSRRVIEKCGFTYVKKNVFFAKQLKKEIEDVNYILFKEEYLKRNNKVIV
ncbi:MAG TPA: GNAT family protein [Clostridia bacterium]